jgi:hypothetical protein
MDLFGIARLTLRRWLAFFRSTFIKSSTGKNCAAS